MKTVLVLGCGPAALFAAYGVERVGWARPVIAGIKRKSEMFGAQYLHRPIPNVSGDGFLVRYGLEGTAEGYRDKVYGTGYRGSVSPDELAGEHMGWDIREAYGDLWSHFQAEIEDVKFGSSHEAAAFIGGVTADHVISTIPAPLLCMDPTHGFSAQEVWALGDAPERGVFTPIITAPNTVVCSGDPKTSWYRRANILGYNTVEWPLKTKPPISGVSKVQKPMSTNCDCLPFIHRMGRYGKWQKGILSHEAYYETVEGLGVGV